MKEDINRIQVVLADKKVSKIEKFYDGIVRTEVSLSILADPQNKNVKMRVMVPGNELVVERNSDKFENAVVDCVDVLKGLLVSEKEKRLK